MTSKGRLYYRVIAGQNLDDITVINNKTGNPTYYPLYDNMLFTEREYNYMKEHADRFNEKWFERVIISQKKTYCFFGARFEI